MRQLGNKKTAASGWVGGQYEAGEAVREALGKAPLGGGCDRTPTSLVPFHPQSPAGSQAASLAQGRGQEPKGTGG